MSTCNAQIIVPKKYITLCEYVCYRRQVYCRHILK